MRFRGHPLHVMLIHFPVALWPAHAALHLFGRQLPAGVPGVAGFWGLVAGTGLGWLAAGCGAMDLLRLQREGDARRLTVGLWHALLNGTALGGFTAILAAELPHYPAIAHTPAFIGAECGLLLVLGAGNFLGGELVWRQR